MIEDFICRGKEIKSPAVVPICRIDSNNIESVSQLENVCFVWDAHHIVWRYCIQGTKRTGIGIISIRTEVVGV